MTLRYRLTEAWNRFAGLWRWPIARWLDARRPRRHCWGDLCMWALGYGWEPERVSICIDDARREGSCFCGCVQCPERLRDLGMDPSDLKSDTFVEP